WRLTPFEPPVRAVAVLPEPCSAELDVRAGTDLGARMWIRRDRSDPARAQCLSQSPLRKWRDRRHQCGPAPDLPPPLAYAAHPPPALLSPPSSAGLFVQEHPYAALASSWSRPPSAAH